MAQFAQYGQPDMVISDNRPQFACAQFCQFAVEWESEHLSSSPRHLRANGKATGTVKITKNLCKKAAGKQGHLESNLSMDSTPA